MPRARSTVMHDPLPVLDRVGLSPSRLEAIVEAVAQHYSLDTVVRWGLATTPPRFIANVVVQDEYTHDVVLPWDDTLWLVYDTT